MGKALVEQQFGRAAADYAACSVHASGPSLARMLALAAPEPGWRALDVATGAGHTAMAFAPHVASVVATDITAEMLAEARRLSAQRGLANVTTARADAAALPWDDASFELVTCRLAAHHFGDPPAFVTETWRVLVPGGTFLLVDNVSPDAGATAAAYNAFETLRDPSHSRCLGLGEWLQLLRGAGFVDMRYECIDQDIEFGAWTERMRCDAATVARLEASLRQPPLRDFLNPRRDERGLVFTLQEAIVAARKPDPK
jgi:SAM-dependent methyltransferase